MLFKAWLTSPGTKGALGEKKLQARAAIHLDQRIYRAFHNLILPIDGETTQLDHLYVSPFGIFVVETKNYSGWIFGSARQRQWTQVLYQKKHSFQNPLHQNYRHIKAAAAVLRLPESSFHSVIVFTGSDYTFKTEMPDNVCDLKQFDTYVHRFKQRILSDADIQAACTLLAKPEYAAGREREQQHIRNLKKRQS